METLDCRGLPCPQPVVRCRALVDERHPEHCSVLVDNDAAVSNVRRFMEQRGYTVTVAQEEASLWRLHAAHDGVPAPQPTPQAAKAARNDGGRTLVFITTETLGRGSDDLGGKLMATFLATLPELGDALWRVVLLNGGVKLCAGAPGPALDALRQLEAAGVSVLVCGTCLAHYGLTAAKSVGETSNMLDIVTSLALADKIIRP